MGRVKDQQKKTVSSRPGSETPEKQLSKEKTMYISKNHEKTDSKTRDHRGAGETECNAQNRTKQSRKLTLPPGEGEVLPLTQSTFKDNQQLQGETTDWACSAKWKSPKLM